MTAPRAPFHVPANLDATLHAAICDLRTTTRLNDGTRSEQVRRWAAEIKVAASELNGSSAMDADLFDEQVRDAVAHLERYRPAPVEPWTTWLGAVVAVAA